MIGTSAPRMSRTATRASSQGRTFDEIAGDKELKVKFVGFPIEQRFSAVEPAATFVAGAVPIVMAKSSASSRRSAWRR